MNSRIFLAWQLRDPLRLPRPAAINARIDLPRPVWELSNSRVRCWKILRMADAGRLDRGHARAFLAGCRFVNGSRCPRDGHAEPAKRSTRQVKLMRIKAVVLKRHHCSPQRFAPIDGHAKLTLQNLRYNGGSVMSRNTNQVEKPKGCRSADSSESAAISWPSPTNLSK